MRLLLITLFVLALAPSARADDRSPDDWRALTFADVDAAHALIMDNHPGALPELQDGEFRARLNDSWVLARTRAESVSGFGGYAATLRGFASGLGDKHIAWQANRYLIPVRYAGFWVRRRGAQWTVVGADTAGSPPISARLVACDGQTPDALLQARVGGFRADPSSPAQMARADFWLFIDDGNPFVPRPRQCDFDLGDSIKTIEIVWREIDTATLSKRVSELYPATRAGFGVSEKGTLGWIAVEHLDANGAAVIGDVKSRWRALVDKPALVIDLRGNGGGDSTVGDDLARLLYGPAAVSRAQLRKPECGSVWRASAGNLRTLEAYQTSFAERGEAAVQGFRTEARAVQKAMAAGRPLSGDVSACLHEAPARVRPTAAPVDAPFQGKVLLLTDGSCFSSCLLMVDLFRSLGAIHIGQPTDGGVWYMEVRDEPLPSGLGTFSVLGKVGLGAPRRLGPFVPDLPFDGDMAETEALEAWIAATFQP
jgi:hypothetical protein